jgi:hypothetical protein
MPRTYNHKYCCEECRHASIAAFDKEVRSRIRAALKCDHCGEPIVDAKKASQRYCCHRCRNMARTVRAAGRIEAIRCIDCNGEIPGAARRDTKRCPVCNRNETRRRNKERAREKRAMSQSMSHAIAVASCKPLKIKGSGLQHGAT